MLTGGETQSETAQEADSILAYLKTVGGRKLARRYVPGTNGIDAVALAREAHRRGLYTSLTFLREPPHGRDEALARAASYVAMAKRLAEWGFASRGGADLTVSLRELGADSLVGVNRALEHVYAIAKTTARAASTVTIGLDNPGQVDLVLDAATVLRQQYPWVGVTLSAAMQRTENDVKALRGEGIRVRLVAEIPTGPADAWSDSDSDSRVFGSARETEASYLRSATWLLDSDSYPMFATSNPRLLRGIWELAKASGRQPGTYEYQANFGVRPDRQLALADSGQTLRVLLPVGDHWRDYVVTQLLEDRSVPIPGVRRGEFVPPIR